jgi:hypothetical protein
MARLLFKSAMLQISPPWLRRVVGAKLMESLGEEADDLLDRFVSGVKLRFPTDDADPDALARIGRERRIRRGPGELGQTYARRVRTWWDDHRTRGGAFAMLRQLYAFWRDSLNPRMDVVYHSGTRRWVDSDGVITRDAITWSAPPNGDPAAWANIWVFYHLGDAITETFVLTTDDGDPLVTDEGDELVALVTSEDGTISDELAEQFLCIPREWSAAHIQRVTVVLLYGSAELWDYPQPVHTWDEVGHAPWDENVPVILIAE